MQLKFWMVLKAIVVLVFGVVFVVAPAWAGGIFGMETSKSAVLLGQLFGTAFIFEGILLWLGKNFPWPEAQKFVIAVVVSNAIGAVICLIGTLNGTWNALGWLPVVLYAVFCLVFAYFLFIKKSV